MAHNKCKENLMGNWGKISDEQQDIVCPESGMRDDGSFSP